MTQKSDDFEHRIHRLVEVIEGSGADVIWNDRIPDPDNLAQLRQIDITIRRNGALSLVECRDQKSPQDVKWIEELLGRRISLQAASVIAVSSSGFTDGAIKKANSHGILLRDLRELVSKDVESWGCTIEMRLYYYQYENIKLTIFFNNHNFSKLSDSELAEELKYHPIRQSLFNTSAEQFDGANLNLDDRLGINSVFDVKLKLTDCFLCNAAVEQVEFSGNARLKMMNINLPLFLAYGEPQKVAVSRNTGLKKASDSDMGFIVHNSDKVATVVDLRGLELPSNCQLRYFRVTSDKVMDMDSLEIIGSERLCVSGGPMAVELFVR